MMHLPRPLKATDGALSASSSGVYYEVYEVFFSFSARPGEILPALSVASGLCLLCCVLVLWICQDTPFHCKYSILYFALLRNRLGILVSGR